VEIHPLIASASIYFKGPLVVKAPTYKIFYWKGAHLVHKPVSEKAVQGGKAVLPGDFFSFFVGPAVIGDGDLEYSASDLGYFHRDFRLKAKAIRLDLDFLQYIRSEGLVADLHVGEVQIG